MRHELASVPHSQTSRIARGPFVLAVIAVYAVELLVADAAVGAGDRADERRAVRPGADCPDLGLDRACTRRRLRDAGRPTGLVIGIAMIYALEVVLLTLLIWIAECATPAPATSPTHGAGIFHLFIILYLLGCDRPADPNLGALQIWLMGFAA